MTGRRLDEALAARGLVQSRARARDAVLRGIVQVNGAPARKPSQTVADDDQLTLVDASARYVSRAALKLAPALAAFGIDPAGRHCMDIGASTGGFTQVLLEQGAAHVTAIDVGHGQLAAELAADSRVTSIEGLNVRGVTAAMVPPQVSLVVCDVSFISLRVALAALLPLLPRGCALVALVKPQFEVGRDHVGKGGIVTDPAQQQRACDDVAAWLQSVGWQVAACVPSPLPGSDGNRELLLFARKA